MYERKEQVLFLRNIFLDLAFFGFDPMSNGIIFFEGY